MRYRIIHVNNYGHESYKVQILRLGFLWMSILDDGFAQRFYSLEKAEEAAKNECGGYRETVVSEGAA